MIYLRNTFRRIVQSCIAVTSLLFCGFALSLGLGDLRHDTYLGEQLDAQLSLIGVENLSAENIRISQLSAADAKKLGVDFVYSPYRVDFAIQTNGDAITGVRVLSRQAIVEPFVNLLIELEWPGGSVFREYALLFDAAPLNSGSVQSGLPTRRAPNPNTAISLRDPSGSTAASSGLVNASNGASYTVRSGDTLSGIVSRIDLPNDVSANQAIEAIHSANRRAFQNGNINRLMAGATLILPSGVELGASGSQSGSSAIPEKLGSPTNVTSQSSPLPRQLKTAAAESQAATSEMPNASIPAEEPIPAMEGRLSLSQGRSRSENGADYTVPQIREQLDSTQEMIDLLVKENEELRDRVEKIESSEYLTTLTQLVAMQRQQINELREEFRGQAGPSEDVGQKRDASGTSVSNPVPLAGANGETLQPTLSQALAANFGLFIGVLLFGLCLIAAIVFLAYKLLLRKDQVAEPQPDATVEDSMEPEFAMGSTPVVSVDAGSGVIESERAVNNVTNFHEAIEGRRARSLTGRIDDTHTREKKSRDNEVKERIKQKTEEYKTQASSQAPARINEVEIDVLVGLDEEINELLSMAKIYCSAGKYSEARAILTAQQKVESDPRLVDALAQIDEMERTKKAK